MRTSISTHSFIDLITNSSSELFILDTKKSLDAVKKVIEKLAELYNQRSALADRDHTCVSVNGLWGNVFSEPKLSEWSFSLNKFPRYDDWVKAFGRCYDYNSEDKHPVKEECYAMMSKWNNKNPPPNWKQDGDNTEYNAYYAKKAIEEEMIYKDWRAIVIDLYASLYEWTAKENKINLKPLGKLAVSGGVYARVYFEVMRSEKRSKKDAKAARYIEEIENAVIWGYTFKKGDVFLGSASDNSIPYDFWSDIESTFNCQRMHLG